VLPAVLRPPTSRYEVKAGTIIPAVLLTGVIQGGGPCHWALEDHIRAGQVAYATPEADVRKFLDLIKELQG
jgi:uncharacterized protein (DUF1786 family)